jgi:YVTN family beta-propeller protein
MARQIFISYSKRDAEFALQLAADLEDAGHEIWIDREIEGGQQWRRTIEKAVQDSVAMIVVISKNSIKSRWVQHEGSVAYGLGKSLYPILLDEIEGENPFVWMDEIQWVDFANNPYKEGFRQLLEGLTPPNPIQDLLDQQMTAYRQTGDLLGEAMLVVIEEARSTLLITPEEEELIEMSAKALRFRRRLLQGGLGLVIALVVVAIISVGAMIQAGNQRDTLVETKDFSETQIANLATQQAVVGYQATLAVQDATQQFSVLGGELAELAAQATAVSEEQATAQALADQAQEQLNKAQTELQGILDEAGLALVDNGPMDMIWYEDYLWVANRESDTVQRVDPRNKRVSRTVSVEDEPVALLQAGDVIWVANHGDNSLSMINRFTSVLEGSVPVGNGPRALASDGETLWVANEYDNTVQRLDSSSGVVLATVEVGSGPVSLVHAGEFLWVANFEANNLQRISTQQGSEAVVGSYPVGSGPTELLWDGSYLWIACRVEDEVQRFNPATLRVDLRISVSDAPSALSFDGASIWVANRGNDTVEMVDPEAGMVLSTYEVGNFPRSLVWDGSNIWVGNYYDRSLQVIDREAGAVVTSIDVGDQPRNLLVTEDHLWVISEGEKSVEQIDLETLDVVSSVQIDGRPTAMVYAGNQLWVADYSRDRIVHIANVVGGNALLIEPSDREEQTGIFEIPVGDGPRDLAWDGGGIWVADYLGDSLTRINPQNPEDSLEITGVGDGPNRLIFDGSGLWVAVWNGREVFRLDLETGLRDVVIELEEARPTDIAWDGEFVWVLLGEIDQLVKFDALTGEAVGDPILVGEEPRDILLAGEAVWVANQKGNSLQRIDRQTSEITQEIPVEDDPVYMVMIEDDIWVVAQTSNAVQQVDGDIIALLELSARISTE